MDERAALDLVGGLVSGAGDDAAVVDGTALTIDMLHETTDFPPGTTRYTAGWRAVGASLSDVAATGADATAAVAAYAAPEFEEGELSEFVAGANEVCDAVGAAYVGGDLDGHDEFTVATAAVGDADGQVGRDGARPGDAVVVTGSLGRSAAAIEYFERGDTQRANALFQFMPRVAAGRALAGHATAMMDSSDGLARSLHQLSEGSGCGFDVDSDRIPVADDLEGLVADPLDRAVTFGEDFELVATVPPERVEAARGALSVDLSVVGEVTESGILLDGDPLPDEGWTH
ncbi:thiamine-phosphate kinase [Halobacterium jilantaiense]|uniref:Thiamine-monophosphate kinase n=1 Tax=Halobacterium jilantaiense TaxID=355548 RepID=A0A1I0Q5D6_9EURY|nr:thiamine-phosphate kinase [Halobacterium jilantaiense]SEW22020.1 thiamine-phosphate kinase [Halobacterium jilantaiense]